MKEKVIALLTKRGYNEERAIELVESNFDDAMKIAEASSEKPRPSQIADIISAL